MEIARDSIRIESKNNITPTDIEIIGMGMDGYVVFKYKQNDKINYSQYSPNRRMYNYLFFEIINNSPLWNINFQVTPYTGWNNTSSFFDIKYAITILKMPRFL